MPSKLENLKRMLAWSDFTTKPATAPGAGQFAVAAFTDSAYRPFNWSVAVAPNSKPTAYQLADNITITIELRPGSWVASWVSSRSAQEKKDLLNHEQGHYNITALMARDLFVDLMLLKSKQFSDAQKAKTAIETITKRYSTSEIQKIHTKYDSDAETKHGFLKAGQTRWDGYLNKAFTTPRTPASSAPDGTAHKITLLEVLKAAGKGP
jgi:hypothetical protein